MQPLQPPTRQPLASLLDNGPVHLRQQRLVDEVVASLRGGAARNVDTSEAASVLPIDGPTKANDPKYDGCLVGKGGISPALTPLDDVAPVLPDNGAAVEETVIVVNGIMTDVAIQQLDMQALANTGCAVRGVHNATAGMGRDLLECVLNKLDRGDTPAIDTLARLIARGLDEGKPVRVIGHSQGALITARALQIVADVLRQSGLGDGAVKQQLALVSVETWGGASQSYVDGPRYLHTVNQFDVVPMLSGVGLHGLHPFVSPGQDAVVRRFRRFNAPTQGGNPGTDLASRAARFVDQTVHGPRDVYWKFRAAAANG
jgi:hypothetical protein